jgi:putative tricarboxylic transport membrane protein
MYELLWTSLVGLFQLKYLLPLVIGTVIGVVGGALPGVTSV